MVAREFVRLAPISFECGLGQSLIEQRCFAPDRCELSLGCGDPLPDQPAVGARH
jgi:hypothetical protein